MTRIFVEGIEFYAFHGVPDEEQVVGHRYVVDISLSVHETASETDAVDDTVDYGAVAQLVVKIGTESKVRTVERVARLMGEAILLMFAKVDEVEVRLAKRLPPAAVIAEEAGVELTVVRR